MPITSTANALRRPRITNKSSSLRPSSRLALSGSASELPHVDTSFLESLLGYNARRAALAVIAVFLRRMEPYGVRPVDFSVLSLIAHNPGVTSRQICVTLDILPPNLVAMVKGLQKRGLIVQQTDPVDRRAKGLHLSEAGQTLYDEAQATASSLEREVAGKLTPDELGTLIALLRKVYRS